MNLEELQDAFTRYDKRGTVPPITTSDMLLFIEAARPVANPNIEAAVKRMKAWMDMQLEAVEAGYRWPSPEMCERETRAIVTAALTPLGDDE